MLVMNVPISLARVLADRGVLIGVILNRRSLRGMFVNSRERRREGNGYVHYQHAYPKWKSAAMGRHFEMLHEEGCCWFALRRSSNSRLVPVFASIERLLGLRRLVSLSPWIIFIARKRPMPLR